MKPEKLLQLPPGKGLLDTVLNDEMAQTWARLRNLSEQYGFPRQAVGLISFGAKAGTTTVTIALARFLAYRHKRKVCVVEANLRNPTLGKILPRLKKEPGFNEVINGKVPLDQAIRVVDTKGLHLLTAGEGSDQVSIPNDNLLDETLTTLRERFDVLLFDCPPLSIAAEANYLLRAMDVVILVARASRTRIEQVAQAAKSIRALDKPLGGIVLNQVIQGLPAPLRSLF